MMRGQEVFVHLLSPLFSSYHGQGNEIMGGKYRLSQVERD